MVADIFCGNYAGPEFDPRKLIFRILMPGEKELIEKALGDDIDVECFLSDDTLGLLDQFECRSKVTKLNVVSILKEIAQQDLLQKPHSMATAWKHQFEGNKGKADFKDSSAVKNLYERTTFH